MKVLNHFSTLGFMTHPRSGMFENGSSSSNQLNQAQYNLGSNQFGVIGVGIIRQYAFQVGQMMVPLQ